jgi:hypothetical protein
MPSVMPLNLVQSARPGKQVCGRSASREYVRARPSPGGTVEFTKPPEYKGTLSCKPGCSVQRELLTRHVAVAARPLHHRVQRRFVTSPALSISRRRQRP